jgi:hypothetical protein
MMRPGGGNSFSGGGGGGWGGGGGGWSSSGSSWGGSGGYSSGGGHMGGAELLVLVVIVVIVAIIKASIKGNMSLDIGNFDEPTPPPPPPPDLRQALAATDPAFSEVLFNDFVYALYARAQIARAEPRALAQLSPWIDPLVRDQLASRATMGKVGAVVVGSMRVVRHVRRADAGQAADSVRIAFEVNQFITDPAGKSRTIYLVEEWVFRRNVGVQSRAHKGAITFDCPNCGAPSENLDGGRCQHCDQVVDGGRFDWLVIESVERSKTIRGPQLTGTVAEVGTGGPTIFDPGLRTALAELEADDPEVTPEALGARLKLIYDELNRGWNAQDAALIRPLVSDGMMGYQTYWLEAYKAQGLKNQLEGAALQNFVMVKVRRDPSYDAVTLRFWASGADYTVDTNGRVVGGSRGQQRQYSEYWTLIRGAGVRGKPHAEAVCPSCGAALKVGMGGECEYCGAHVTRGEFDWVLSRIEQDEAYRG